MLSNEDFSTNDYVKCPLCYGQGRISRKEVLERLGMRDLARVAQLSAEEVLKLSREAHKQEESSLWMRFEAELTKRLNDVRSKHQAEILAIQTEKEALSVRLEESHKSQDTLFKNARNAERLEVEKRMNEQLIALTGKVKEFEMRERLTEQQRAVELQKVRAEYQLQTAKTEKDKNDLDRRVADYSTEIAYLRNNKKELEAEIFKIVRSGRMEEVSFAEEALTWPGVWLSEKLNRNGDYLLAYRGPRGEPLEPRMLVDNKDKSHIGEEDVEKLIRDAKEQGTPVAALVTRNETQLRTFDKDRRWASKDGVWILRTARPWFRRDLDVLKPFFETMRKEGADFLTKNSRLAAEVSSTLSDIDEIERELRKAAKAVECAKELASAYRSRLQHLCDSATLKKSCQGASAAEISASA